MTIWNNDEVGGTVWSDAGAEQNNLIQAQMSDLAASGGSALVGFTTSGTPVATQTVQEKLRQTKAVVDFITDSTIRAAVISGSNTSDVSSYVQAAITSSFNLDFQGYIFHCHGLTQSANFQSFVSTSGIARIIKNANGALFTSTGNNVLCSNLNFRGDASSPTFTGDGAVFTGENPMLINCGSRWMTGRALKCTGGHAQVIGTCDIYQTTDATASGYDIEIRRASTTARQQPFGSPLLRLTLPQRRQASRRAT